MSSRSRSRNPRVQRERREYRPEGSERVSTPDGVAERGWVQVYTEDMIQRANNYTKQLYDKVDDLAVEVGRMESGVQTWVGPNGLMRKQMNEHKNIVSGFGALEKKVAVIEKGQVDKKMMAKNFKRIGDLEKKVASLEAELKKCCTKSARSSRSGSTRTSRSGSTRSSRSGSTRSSRSGSTRSSRSRGSRPRTQRRRRGLSFNSEDTYDSDVSYTSDQQERMYRAQV
tara:strand:- start:5702 stop:6382 length:681 start_codon:yes stop_codon:yes gene_type:complete